MEHESLEHKDQEQTKQQEQEEKNEREIFLALRQQCTTRPFIKKE